MEDSKMKKIALLFSVLLLTLTGCSGDKKPEKVFQPVPPNPEYIVVIKKQTPDKVLGNTVIQGDETKKIVDQINASHKTVASMSCPASVDSLDVIFHYSNGSIDRTLTVLPCPGTIDQVSGDIVEPGIRFDNSLDKLFKQ
jgi:hypothetical protein